MKLTFNVEPVAKGRARTKFINGQVITYTPTKTAEAQLAIQAMIQSRTHKMFPPHTPLKLTATFFRTKSKWLKKCETMPFRKPDLDNFCKLISDSINGLLLPDDAQITTMILKKRWSTNGHGSIELELTEDGK